MSEARPSGAADEQDTAGLEAEIARLEQEAAPLHAELDRLRAEADALRTELRRRRRLAQLRGRQEVRAQLAAGELPTLEDVVSGADPRFEAASLDDLRFLRESATEVRLGYASASRQSLSFTDGSRTEDASDIAVARSLWEGGWEFGTPLARGVRIYPAGSRAERVVAATEIRVEAREPG
jgi:multidrug efflux pump subunit AcrA (membrane-fusion protein)